MAAVSFFAQQERARKASTRLFVLYALSVVAIVLCVNLLVALVFKLFSHPRPENLVLVTSLVTLAVIALGTLEILARLSLSQHALAAMLSGRPVPRNSGSDDERRLINIVDEMSIASGLAAPPVYVLNREKGINAFAAGASPSQAIVVVTQGAIEQLSRDELQAVIAHEFSHILNGDIRVNLRAIYVLQGIVFLSAIGRFMMRFYSGFSDERGGRGLFHLPLAVAGVGVFAIGSVGYFFCRFIQASISRERENLADASAVQFTRNADALCGALARIRMHDAGSSVRNWHGDALAHMLFAPNAGGWLRTLFATHPDIEERMRRINPHVSPQFYLDRAKKPRQLEQPKAEAAEEKKEKERPRTIVPTRVTAVSALVAAIGAPQHEHLEYAQGVLAYLVVPLREALLDGTGARAAMLACVLEQELSLRTAQLSAIEARAGAELARKAEVLAPHIWKLDRAYRLPLIALAIPTLKALPEAGRDDFLAVLRAAIEADRRLTLSEFVLATILDWTLGPKAKRSGKVTHHSRDAVAGEASLILSLLARAGSQDAAAAEAAFAHGRETLAMPALVLLPLESLQLARVSEALESLAGLVADEKEKLVEGFAEVVAHDGNVRLMEHELLRAVACVLDCPMPPSVAALDPRLLRK